jgi:hypothetical protein
MCNTLHKYSPQGESTEAEENAGALVLSHNQVNENKTEFDTKTTRIN